MAKILVTGATGNVGGAVLRSLLDRGTELIATSRDVRKLSKISELGVEVRQLDITDSFTWGEALEGVDKVFLFRPPDLYSVRREIEPFLEYLSDINLFHIAFLSILGAEQNLSSPHSKIEQCIIRSWIPYTFLRTPLFMQNFVNIHREEILSRNELYTPVRTEKVSYVDLDDVAAAVAAVLLEEGHLSKAYDLVGTELLEHEQIAKDLSKILDRKITVNKPPFTEFLWTKRKQKNPLSYISAILTYEASTLNGRQENSSAPFERLLGRKPTSMSEFLNKNKNKWE